MRSSLHQAKWNLQFEQLPYSTRECSVAHDTRSNNYGTLERHLTFIPILNRTKKKTWVWDRKKPGGSCDRLEYNSLYHTVKKTRQT